MEVLLLLARAFLAIVFGIAGVSKAIEPVGSRRVMISFGVPEKIAGLFGRILPYVEVFIAVSLLPLVSAWWAAVAALALLLLFTTAITVSLARGEAPDCRCFGQLHSEPVSKKTVLRNLLLAAVAGFIVLRGSEDPGLSGFDWLGEWRTAEIATFVVAAVGVALLIKLLTLWRLTARQQTTLFNSIDVIRAALEDELGPLPAEHPAAVPLTEGLPIGALAPKFSLAAISGGVVTLDSLLNGEKPIVLLFVGPNCWGCKLLLPSVRGWQLEYAERLTFVVISHGASSDGHSTMARYELDPILLDENSAVADKYQAHWTPAAVRISFDGTIASHIVFGDNAIREWFRNMLAAESAHSERTDEQRVQSTNGRIPQVSIRYATRQIGEPPPKFSLPDLAGKTVDIDELFDRPTLLLFWHPQCEFCQAMIDELKWWEEHPPPGAPRLLFIASGDVEEIRAVNQSFKSMTLLDPEFDIAPLFGTKVTPAAILIDAKGRVASSLAITDQNVRALIGLERADSRVRKQI